MKKIYALLTLIAVTAPAGAQPAPEKITLQLTGIELQAIGQGLGKLPYETAAPVIQSLQAQISAADKAAKDKADAEKAAVPTQPAPEKKP